MTNQELLTKLEELRLELNAMQGDKVDLMLVECYLEQAVDELRHPKAS